MRPATRSWKRPLGGTRGDWRYRLLHFHVPIALATAVVLVLFLTLSPFDANVYPHADISGGTFPQQRGVGRPMDHGGALDGPIDDGGDHGRDRTGAMDHGGGQAEPTDRGDHGGGQGGSTDHDEGQTGAVDSDQVTESRAFIRRFTIATGYVATGLLALTLLVGPANLLLGRRDPVSTYLRRDVGTWTAIFSVVHVIFGLQVHGTGRLSGFLAYFVVPDGSPLTNSFGLGNWSGLAATVIVVGLLAISSDFALRIFKARSWKNLQRLNYALFALVVVHAFFYGALVRTNSPYTLLLLFSVVAVFGGQALGIWLWRRRRSRTAAGSA
jgi:methionine sulfoxide reductase heme-binding subunit